jgi:hypothetical protein
MIIYDLRCANDHHFEGWFQSAADFDAQLGSQLLSCPQCDSHAVRRVPSAVAIGSHAAPVAPPVSGSGNAVMSAGGGEIMAAYRQLLRAVIANSEDVGDLFAEEARKIHYAEAPERAIRGNATPDDLEALADEGIAVIGLPKLRDETH